MRYGEVGSSVEKISMEIVSGDSSGGITTISGLTIKTMYMVEVAAETSSGTGIYSFLQTFETLDCELSYYLVHLSINFLNNSAPQMSTSV